MKSNLLGLLPGVWFIFGCFASDQSTIGKNGVGPIRANTIATAANLKKLFPKYTIKHEQRGSEGEMTAESFLIFKGSLHVMDINTDKVNSTKIFGVEIFDPEYKSPVGFGVNSTLSSLLENKGPLKCSRGYEESESMVFCHFEGQKNITYTFPILSDGDEDAASYGKEVRVTNPKNRRIESILWKP